MVPTPATMKASRHEPSPAMSPAMTMAPKLRRAVHRR
jgi:hypothetical protein